MNTWKYINKLTPKQVMLQASPRHEFVYEKAMLILKAETDQLHKIRMIQLAQVVDFRLQFVIHQQISKLHRLIEINSRCINFIV